MAEVRFQIDDPYLERIKNNLGTPNAKTTDLMRDALTILSWAAEERSKGRYILSSKRDGTDVGRLVMPILEAVPPAAAE
jgi:hypothetical protein